MQNPIPANDRMPDRRSRVKANQREESIGHPDMSDLGRMIDRLVAWIDGREPNESQVEGSGVVDEADETDRRDDEKTDI